ncbi:hypothetical protein PG997_012475 [Apiospora hydei]|uniref:DUF6606 domain-containing protein n=1 Tax=Apiospora hydei TaxID=1337664 RepID=A0ABR1V3G5_9PEZI
MASLEAVYNHLVLPPKVPGGQDSDLDSIQNDILRRLLEACHCLRNITGPELEGTWEAVAKSLKVCQQLNQGRLDKDKLVQAFNTLDNEHVLILYVVQQNAALVIRRHFPAGEDRVIFESFEVSPPPSQVLAAEDALQWDFPGRSAEISTKDFQRIDFQESLSLFLEQASLESLQSLAAKVEKAGISVIEPRSTVDPALLSQMLMSLLEAVGVSYDAPGFGNGFAMMLPFWLLLRVSIHRFLKIRLGDDEGQACYKVLIVMILAHLLDDCASKLNPESTVLLQNKLCRRLAKLSKHVKNDSELLVRLLDIVTPIITPIVTNAEAEVQSTWDRKKATYIRVIPKLELHAQPADQFLQLPNSIGHLEALLRKSPTANQTPTSSTVPKLGEAMQKINKFTQIYLELGDYESSWSTWEVPTSLDLSRCRANCLNLSMQLRSEKLQSTLWSLKHNPEHISSYLLAVFNIWTRLDQEVIKLCPLLQEFHPIFSPEMLDTLHVSTYDKLDLLRRIQTYLRRRIEKAGVGSPSILSEIDKKWFAAQYFQDASDLKEYHATINSDSEVSRDTKEEEWIKCREQYRDLSQRICDDTCVCTIDFNGDRDIRGCTKCYYIRSRRRLEITCVILKRPQLCWLSTCLNIYEIIEMLPGLFAFMLPSQPTLGGSRESCKIRLEEYSQLNGYMAYQSGSVTLASDKKPRCYVEKEYVLLPNPLDFAYYDQVAKIWIKDPRDSLTLHHICGTTKHPALGTSAALSTTTEKQCSLQLSTYKIVANQNRCPREMSVQEFAAHQQILSSTNLRWVEILREIQSPNLNLGDENTMFTITHLVLQAGPSLGSSILGEMHVPFLDSAFRKLLAHQINQKLRAIRFNTREAPCMDLLLTLSLRLFEFGQGLDRSTAENLVQEIRAVTLGWIAELQSKSQCSTDRSSALLVGKYMFWASLICRRTFLILINATSLSKDELRDHTRASLCLQMNIIDDPAKLSLVPRTMFVRDAKIAALLKAKICNSIMADSTGLEEAICVVWQQSEKGQHQSFSSWKQLSDVYEYEGASTWIAATLTSTIEGHEKQIIHYSYVEGYLLIDGKPFGKLPLEIRNSEDVVLLFGNQNLLTSPSPLKGMSHQLLANPRDHKIHFGLRNGKAII